MESFTQGQRVVVGRIANIPLNAKGTVTRVCTDGRAWVMLDQRSKVSAVHPFSDKDKSRRRSVLADPEHCLPALDNHKARRDAKRDARKEEALANLSVEKFGKDHWSTFAYLETRIVDHRGVPAFPHLRCHPGRHPLYDHGHDASKYPTRLKNDEIIENHDDWDCIDDLISADLLELVGTAANPQYALTERGSLVARALRDYKAKGGNFHSFTPPPE